MCSKVLNGHIILTDTSITTILAPEMTYTPELICLLFAAWKAPAWVREIGLLVLVTDLIWQLKGMFNAAEVVQQVGDVPLTLVAGGLKVSFISLIYALLIYAASLVIRMLQKPRI